MAARRPILGEAALLTACDEVWKIVEADWLEAFRSHPRIGDSHARCSLRPSPLHGLARNNEKSAQRLGDIKAALAEGNRAYEQKFNRIFIVCATGKSAPEILAILERRSSCLRALGWRTPTRDRDSTRRFGWACVGFRIAPRNRRQLETPCRRSYSPPIHRTGHKSMRRCVPQMNRPAAGDGCAPPHRPRELLSSARPSPHPWISIDVDCLQSAQKQPPPVNVLPALTVVLTVDLDTFPQCSHFSRY